LNGNSRNAPLIVRSTVIEKGILILEVLKSDTVQVAMDIELELFLKEFNGEIKSDFADIDKLSNNAFNVVVDRDDCLRGISNEILRRWLLKDGNLERRFVDRYIGLQAAPGGGKSQLMDYISELKGTIMDHVDIGAVFQDIYGSYAVLSDDTITMVKR
jgi:hypothetical protein